MIEDFWNLVFAVTVIFLILWFMWLMMRDPRRDPYVEEVWLGGRPRYQVWVCQQGMWVVATIEDTREAADKAAWLYKVMT